MSYDPNKIKPVLTPNWTQQDGRSKPFFQSASGSLPDRYSTTVVSNYTTTGGSQVVLQQRLQEQVITGSSRILKHFSKTSNATVAQSVTHEDYYISPRPTGRMKVLVSIPYSAIKNAPDKTVAMPAPVSVTHEIQLNTIDVQGKIKTIRNFLDQYEAEISRFQGKLYGLNLGRELTKFKSVFPALKNLILDNDIVFSENKSELIMIGVDNDYKVLYVQMNQGKGFVTLSKGFDNFLSTPGINNPRSIYLLTKLGEIETISKEQKRISWTTFLKRFILNPPEIDFFQSEARSRPKEPLRIDHDIAVDNEKPVKTRQEVMKMEEKLADKEYRKQLQERLESAESFVGDSVMANLSGLSNTITDVENLYDELLNKVGLGPLVDAALECLDLNRVNWPDLSTDFLNLAENSMEEVQSIFQLPTLRLPDDLPTIDYMGDMVKQILLNVLKTIAITLMSMVIELIKSLFDFCNECAYIDESTGAKRYDNINFGGMPPIGDFLSAVVGNAMGTKLQAATIGAFTESIGTYDQEAAAQEMLKNSINNVDRIYKKEAERIHTVLQTGETSPENEWSRSSFTGTRQQENLLRHGTATGIGTKHAPKNLETFEGLLKAGYTQEMSSEEVLALVKQQTPWSAQVFLDASKDLVGYLDTVNAAVTPGEMANLMLGTSCGTSSEVEEVARNALPEYPAVCLLLCAEDDTDATDENVADLFETIGKFTGRDFILGKIKEISELVPSDFGCLGGGDLDELRTGLTGKKDPSLTRPEIEEMVKKSKSAKEKRLRELADELQKSDFWEGRMPPMTCTTSSDGSFIPGLAGGDPPVTIMMMKDALDVPYESMYMTFADDIKNFVPALSMGSTIPVEVPRTLEVDISIPNAGTQKTRMMNPRFRKLVNEGKVTWGSLPAGALVPGSREPPDPDDLNEDGDAEWGSGDDIDYVPWLSWLSGWDNPMGAGQWEEGQTQPTPDQEYEWEQVNVGFKPIEKKIGNTTYRVGYQKFGGRRFDDEKYSF